MAHVFEVAPSARSKCRGCGSAIAKGEIRFGERVPNAFGEGEMSLWFHPLCAAYKRPDPLLETLKSEPDIPGPEKLEAVARNSLAAEPLQKVGGAERAKTGQAKCRHCDSRIDKDSWRIRIVSYEEGRFVPGGFIHLSCRTEYLETSVDLLEQLLQLSPDLDAAAREDLQRALASVG